jgi:PIN domain nuclease of toxin-antitoxin system
MRLLLDTCTFIWVTSAPDNLSARARSEIDDPDAELFLSDASVWEICLKWQAGKLGLPAPPRGWVEEQRKAWGLARAALELDHFYRSTELPPHHRDPFDRLLVAQAIAEGLTIATPDPAVQSYPTATIW